MYTKSHSAPSQSEASLARTRLRQGDLDAALLSEDPRWAAVRARDARADGVFLYAVKTTGVYCRPSCAARLPRPQNVSFYERAAEAERDGYRACLRCKPEGPPLAELRAQCVAELCRWLEHAEHVPTLAELAARAGLSPFHTQRVFKAHTGMTPRQYAAAHRGQRVRAALTGSATVTQALYEAGYSSSGRFYAEAAGVLGMTPSAFKAGGAEQPIRFALGECSLGSILVAATERGVCAILLGDEPEALLHDLERRFPRAELRAADASFEAQVAQVIGFVEQPGKAFPLPLDLRGTVFQRRVWQALTAIAVGQTRSYSELARAVGEPKAVRAVASACAANALAVAIPCHRVVRTDGSLSGYRWGIERKRELLVREQQRTLSVEREAQPGPDASEAGQGAAHKIARRTRRVR